MGNLDVKLEGAVEAPQRKSYKQLNVNIKLTEGIGIPEALEAVEGLGEIQGISVYEQFEYDSNPF